MRTAGSIIKYVSDVLNDQEAGYTYQVWSEPFLLNALNDAISRVATNIPWLFRTVSDLTLSPGGVTNLPFDMQYQPEIVGQVCSKGGVRYVRTDVTQAKDTQLNKPTSCCPATDGMFAPKAQDPTDPCSAYKLSQWAVTVDSPGILLVAPEVPVGVSPTVQVSYVSVPQYTLNDTLDAGDRFYSLLVDWMLSRAYSVDIKTPEVIARAKAYESMFMEGVKLAIASLASQNKGRDD